MRARTNNMLARKHLEKILADLSSNPLTQLMNTTPAKTAMTVRGKSIESQFRCVRPEHTEHNDSQHASNGN